MIRIKNLTEAQLLTYLLERTVSNSKGCRVRSNIYAYDYDRVGYNSKIYSLHRLSWAVTHNVPLSSLKETDEICHTCDNKPCFEPTHLFKGTGSINSLDAVAKGRHTDSRGSKHGMAILTEEIVVAMRQDKKQGLTRQQLVIKYNANYATICDVLSNRSWTHV